MKRKSAVPAQYNPKKAISADAQLQSEQFEQAQKIEQLLQPIDPLTPMTLTIENQNTSAAENAIVFNPNNIVTGYTEGNNIVKTLSSGLDYDDWNSSFSSSPVTFVEFQYQVENTLQFSQQFRHIRANIDGFQKELPLQASIQKAKRPTNFDQDLLNIPYVTRIRKFDAWIITLLADETITITFTPLPKGQFTA